MPGLGAEADRIPVAWRAGTNVDSGVSIVPVVLVACVAAELVPTVSGLDVSRELDNSDPIESCLLCATVAVVAAAAA